MYISGKHREFVACFVEGNWSPAKGLEVEKPTLFLQLRQLELQFLEVVVDGFPGLIGEKTNNCRGPTTPNKKPPERYVSHLPVWQIGTIQHTTTLWPQQMLGETLWERHREKKT